jgi:hypothetical protein
MLKMLRTNFGTTLEYLNQWLPQILFVKWKDCSITYLPKTQATFQNQSWFLQKAYVRNTNTTICVTMGFLVLATQNSSISAYCPVFSAILIRGISRGCHFVKVATFFWMRVYVGTIGVYICTYEHMSWQQLTADCSPSAKCEQTYLELISPNHLHKQLTLIQKGADISDLCSSIHSKTSE